MIKTKYVKLLCTSVFLVLALTGCGKKPPTAEELLSQSFAETEYSYVNAKIDSALNVTLNISEALGSDNDNIFNTAINIEGDIESGQSASHFTTKVNTSIDGFKDISSVDETYYSYSDTVTSYSYSNVDNNWVKEELQTNVGVDYSSLFSFKDLSLFDSYELQEISKEDTTYTVKAKLNMQKLLDYNCIDLFSLLTSVQNVSLDDYSCIKLDASYVYDKETKSLQNIIITLDSYPSGNEYITLEDYKLTISDIHFNNSDTVDIPSFIVENCVVKEDSSTSVSIIPYASDKVSQSGVNDCLAKNIFDVDYLYEEDVVNTLKNYYSKEFSSDVISELTNMFNNYSSSDFVDYLMTYPSWNDTQKESLAIIVDMKVFSEDKLNDLIDINDLKQYIDSLSEYKIN
jgi:hypothetical protein